MGMGMTHGKCEPPDCRSDTVGELLSGEYPEDPDCTGANLIVEHCYFMGIGLLLEVGDRGRAGNRAKQIFDQGM